MVSLTNAASNKGNIVPASKYMRESIIALFLGFRGYKQLPGIRELAK